MPPPFRRARPNRPFSPSEPLPDTNSWNMSIEQANICDVSYYVRSIFKYYYSLSYGNSGNCIFAGHYF